MAVDHERFMRVALREAAKAQEEGNIPVGAVVVGEGRVLARGRNEATTRCDVTAHAEAATIRRLSKRLRVVNPGSQADTGPLAGCILYTTVEPCPMCCWATCIAGISTIVIGARLKDVGVRRGEYTIEKLVALTEQDITLISGILREECAALVLGAERAASS